MGAFQEADLFTALSVTPYGGCDVTVERSNLKVAKFFYGCESVQLFPLHVVLILVVLTATDLFLRSAYRMLVIGCIPVL